MSDRRDALDSWFQNQDTQPTLPDVDVRLDLRSPDDEAQDRVIANELGQPHQVVRAYPDLMARSAEQAQVNRATQSTPRLQAWLAQPDNYAVARDDTHNLSVFERVGLAIGSMNPGAFAGHLLAQDTTRWVNQGASLRGLTSPADADRRFRQRLLSSHSIYPALAGIVTDLPLFQQGNRDVEYGRLAYRAMRAAQGHGEALTPEQQQRLDYLALRPEQNDWGPPVIGPVLRLLPQQIGSFQSGAGEGGAATSQEWHNWGIDFSKAPDVPSFAALLPATASTALAAVGGAGHGYLGFGYQQEAGQAYDQMLRAGVTPDIAANRAEQYATWATALEFTGDALGVRLSGGARLASRAVLGDMLERSVGGRAVREAAQAVVGSALDEGAEEASQQLAQIIHQDLAEQETRNGRGNANLGHAWAETLTPDSIQQIFQSFLIGAQGGAGMSVIPAGANFALDMRSMAQASASADHFEKQTRAAQASRLIERGLPQTLESAVSAVDSSSVYMDADKFVEHFQSRGENPYAAAARVGIGEDTLTQALASHGQLEIPTSRFAARLLSDPQNASLAEHTRIAPEAATPAEQKNMAEVVRHDMERMAQETEHVGAGHELGDAVERRLRALFGAASQDGGPNARMAAPIARAIASLPRTAVNRAARSNPEYASALNQRLHAFFETGLDIAGPRRAELLRGASSGAMELPQRGEPGAPRGAVNTKDTRLDNVAAGQRALTADERYAVAAAIAGFSDEEIAAHLQARSQASVRALLSKAKRKLGTALWEGANMGRPASVDPVRLGRARQQLLAQGVPANRVAARLAERFDVPQQVIYKALQRIDRQELNQDGKRDPAQSSEFARRVESAQRAVDANEPRGEEGLVGERDAGSASATPVEDGDATDPILGAQARDALKVAGVRLARTNDDGLGTLRLTVDPSFDLPARLQDALVEQTDRAHDAAIRFYWIENGKDKGDPSQKHDFARDGIYLAFSSVPDALNGTGVGTWLYRQLIDFAARQGLPFFSDGTVSDAAWSMYARKLPELGYDVQQVNYNVMRDGQTYESYDHRPIWMVQSGSEDQLEAAPVPRDDYTIDGPTLKERMTGGASQLAQGERGSIRFADWGQGKFGTAIVSLFEGYDPSTPLHELGGHLFHLILESIATDPEAPAEFKAMWNDTLSWWGVDQAQWDALDMAGKTPFYEQFARSFEAYLMEGKAPSLRLRDVFETFKRWLMSIYRDIRTGRISLQHNLTPEMASVFDRLLATDDEIAEARAAMGSDFKLNREAFKTDEDYANAQRLYNEAHEAQEADLRARAMQAYTRRAKRWWRNAREQMRPAAIRSVDTDPARRAEQWLGLGEWRALPDTELSEEGDIGYVAPAGAMEDRPADLPEMTLSPEALAEEWPDANLPPSLKARTDPEQVLTEAMSLKAIDKGRGRIQAKRIWRFIKDNGGIQDPDGRIRAGMGGGRQRPGVINQNGKTAEQMLGRATAAGYFGNAAASLYFNAEQAAQFAGDIVAARALVTNKHPRTLTEFVRRQGEIRNNRGHVVQRGGIADDRGDVAGGASDAKGGFASLISPSGRPLDYIIRAATEAGYFINEPTQTEFIDALDRESRGQILVADTNNQEDIDQAQRTLDFYERIGIDTTASEAQIKDALYGAVNPASISEEAFREMYQPPRDQSGTRDANERLRLGPNAGFYDAGGKPFNADRDAVRRLNRLFDRDSWFEAELPISRLNATQDTVNPDFSEALNRWIPEGHGLPAVVKYEGRYYVTDGHHRLAAMSASGQRNARVRLYDLDGNTQREFPLLDARPNERVRLSDSDRALLAELDAPIEPQASPDASHARPVQQSDGNAAGELAQGALPDVHSLRQVAQMSDAEASAWYRNNVSATYPTNGGNAGGVTLAFRSEDSLKNPNVRIQIDPDGDAITVFRGRTSGERWNGPTKSDVKKAMQIFVRVAAAIRGHILEHSPPEITFIGATPAHERMYRTMLRNLEFPGYRAEEITEQTARGIKGSAEASPLRSETPEISQPKTIFRLARADQPSRAEGMTVTGAPLYDVHYTRTALTSVRKTQNNVRILRDGTRNLRSGSGGASSGRPGVGEGPGGLGSSGLDSREAIRSTVSDGAALQSPNADQSSHPGFEMFQGGNNEGGMKLTALHNLTPENLIAAAKLGGLPVPSIGVVPEGQGLEDIGGSITLIGRRNLADPAIEPVYDADVWSPTFPRAEYNKVSSKKITAAPIYQAFNKWDEVYGQRFRGAANSLWDNSVNAGKPNEAIYEAGRESGAMAAYLESIGETPHPPIIRDIKPGNLTPWAHEQAWLDFVRENPNMPYFRDAEPGEAEAYTAKATAAARKAIRQMATSDTRHADASEEDRRILANHLIEVLEERAFSDGSLVLSYLDRAFDSAKTAGQQETDNYASRDALQEQIGSRGEEYREWLEQQIRPLFAEPFLRLGRKKAPFTLDNIVEIMSGRVKAQQDHMTFGDGKARAAGAKRFRELEEMRRAAARQIRPVAESAAAQEETKKLAEQWRGSLTRYYRYVREAQGRQEFGATWESFDAAMRALAKVMGGAKTEANMARALRAEEFIDVPAHIIDEGVDVAKAFLAAPVPYFEAKPQRAVALNEFAGAVIPSTAPQAVRDILAENGLPFREYDNKERSDQSKAAAAFASELGHSFNAGGQQDPGQHILFQDNQPIIYHGSAAPLRGPSPIFRSAVERTVEQSTTQTAPAQQWWATISKAPGVKKEELQWIGLEDFLKAQTGAISREDVLSFVRENGVRVEETVLGGESSLTPEQQQEMLPLIEERDRLSGATMADPHAIAAASVDAGIQQAYANWAQAVEAYKAAFNGGTDGDVYEADGVVAGARAGLQSAAAARRSALDARITELRGIDRSSKTKWSQYTLPGGENYRELLLRLPLSERAGGDEYLRNYRQRYPTATTTDAEVRGFHNQGIPLPDAGSATQFARVKTSGDVFRSSHFDQPNILAHVRFNERTDAQGRRTLFMEEVQSDWHQKGREQGYAKDTTGWSAELLNDGQGFNSWQINDEVGNPVAKITGGSAEAAIAKAAEGVPDAPFKNNAWASLAIKRMIRWAAENGFDQIAWTRGQHQVERFNLATMVERISWGRREDGNYDITITRQDGGPSISRDNQSGADLAELIGADVAKKITEDAGTPYGTTKYKDGPRIMAVGEVAGPDLQTGGHGMRAFYDRILPNIANDIGKKYGAKAGETAIPLPSNASEISAFKASDYKIEERDGGWAITRDRSRIPGHPIYATRAEAEAARAPILASFNPIPETVHSLPITPAMRDAVLNEGQTLFQPSGELFSDKQPSLDEFMAALIADLKGERQVYSAKDASALSSQQEVDDARAWFDAHGIDLTKDKEAIREQIVAALEADRSNPNAVHPDDAAPWFGFESGDALIKALSNLKPRNVAIEDQIDKMAYDEYGDQGSPSKIKEAALAAAHADAQARSIEMELAALQKAAGGRVTPVSKVARDYAQDQVESMSVRELRNPAVFLAGERRAARAAFNAAVKQDWAEATRQKQKQLLSFWLYKYATDASEALTKMDARWQRYSTAQTTRAAIGPKNIEQIDAILDSIERGRPQFQPTQTLDEWAEALRQEDAGDLIIFTPEAVEQQIKRSLSSMSFAEVKNLDDVLKNIEAIGRGIVKLRQGREAQRIADIQAGLRARLTEEWSDKLNRKRSLVAPNAGDKAKKEIGHIHAIMLKIDYLARYLDGLKDGGPFMGLMAMAQEAENDLLGRSQRATQDFLGLVKQFYTPAQFRTMLSKRVHIDALNDSRTKAQLISYALNVGNEYNRNALMRGENWSEPTLSAVLSNLDDRDWSFVQALWNFVGQWKEESFALDERTRGSRPPEVQATPFTLPSGRTLSGGYWPVKFDTNRSELAAAREAKSTVIGEYGGSFRQAATNRGRLKGRVGTKGQALSDDFLGILARHTHDSLRDITHRDLIITFRRVKADPELRNMIARVAGRDAVRALDEWTHRMAAATPANIFGDYGRLPAYLRRAGTSHAMGFKLSVATLNLLGHMQAVPRNGILGQMKQAGITIVPGFIDLLRRHAMAIGTGEKEVAERVRFVWSRSEMMRLRHATFDRDINEVKGDIVGRRDMSLMPKRLEDTFQYLNQYTDQVVAIPTWLAAYESARNGKVSGVGEDNEQAAIDYADSVVRMTISAGATKDLAALLASNNQWQRLATMFMGWASGFYNQLFTEQFPGVIEGRISLPKFAANMVWIWLLPAVITTLFYGQGERRDDEDEFEYLARMTGTMLSYPLQTIPLVRDLLSSVVQGYKPQTPITSIMDRSQKLASAVDRGDERQMVKQSFMLGAQITGVPAQIYTTGDYLSDWIQGQEHPEDDPVDAVNEALMRDTR